MASTEEHEEAVELVKKGDTSTLQQMLLNKKIDVNMRDKPGYSKSVRGHDRTLLHIGVLSQQLKVVQFLLDKDADVNAVDDYGDTPLHCAAKVGDIDIIRALIISKANVNLAGKFMDTAFHCAVRSGNLDIVEELLIAGGDVNAAGNDGWTPLHLVSYYGHTELLAKVLAKRASLDAQDKYGDSALHMAARKGHTKIVENLIKAGADPNVTNNREETYLEVAVNRGQSAVVRWITKVHKTNTTNFSQNMKTKISQLVEEAEEVIMQTNELESDTNISEIMINARRKGYTIKVRISKILFCGVSGAGKTSFINLLLKNKFEERHISTKLTKPHQVMAVGKWNIHFNEKSSSVELSVLDLDKEINHFKELLRRKKFDTYVNDSDEAAVNEGKVSEEHDITPVSSPIISPTKPSPLPIEKQISVSKNQSSKSNPSDVWDVLTLLDTGGQPQFINMLPAINNSVMLTFIVHNLQEELSSNIAVMYGYEKPEISFSSYKLDYSYLDFMKTLISVRKSSIVQVPKKLHRKNIKLKNIDDNSYLSLVGTHSDCVKEDKISEVNLTLSDIIQKGKHKHVWQDSAGNYMFTVNNRTSGDEKYEDQAAELIRKNIFELLQKREIYDVPITWVLLELEIRRKCQNKSYIYFKDILDMCIESDLNMNEQEIVSALQFFHLLGVLLYFKELKDVCDIVITDLKWLFNNLTNIVCCTFDDHKRIFTDGYLKFKNNGLLTEEFINHTDLRLDNISVAYFTELLKFLKIIVPVEPDDFCPKNSYFMPCLLPYSPLHKQNEFSCEDVEPLQIQFKSLNTLPRGAFCFLVVYLLQCKSELDFKPKWTKDKSNPQIFSNLVTFYTNTSYCITLVDRFFYLEVQINMKLAENKPQCCNIYFQVKKIIMESLKEVCKQMRLQYSDICFGFNCHCEYMAIVTADYKWIDCSYHRHELPKQNMVWFKEHSQHIQLNTGSDTTEQNVNETKYESVEAPKMKWMYKLVISRISHCWKQVADFLDYPLHKKKEILEKNNGDPKKCCSELLEDWLSSGHEVTWSNLLLVLKDIEELKTESALIEKELLINKLIRKK